jgi:hypothetical protein
MAGFDREGSEGDDDEEDEDEDENSEDDDDNDDEDEDSDEDNDEDEDGGYSRFSRSGVMETSEETQKELQKIQQDEKELLQSMTKSASDDVEKGVHVKAQMVCNEAFYKGMSKKVRNTLINFFAYTIWNSHSGRSCWTPVFAFKSLFPWSTRSHNHPSTTTF